jgi:hypothetical protein
MNGGRTITAAGLTVFAAAMLLVEGLSWAGSARFGPLAATTFACAVRLDALSEVDRSSGLRTGDTVLLPQMDIASRTAGVFHYTPTQAGRAGEAIRVIVARGNRRLTIPYRLRHTDRALTFAAQLAFKIIALGIALLLLWRGSDAASMLLGAWCIGISIGLPDAWWGALPIAGRIGGGVLTAVLWTSAPFLLYMVIDAVATGVSSRARLVCRSAMVLLMLPALVVNTIDAASQALTGCWAIPIAPWFANAAFVSSQLVIVAFFILSYMRTSGLAKQRVRWVFWAFMFSRAGVLLNLINRLAVHPLHLSGFEWATVLVFPIGCTYAILRHRIIDVNFVLNRTLVYTVLTSFVVGVFILLETVLGKAAASRGIGIAVEVGVALLLGFSFNALHKYVETSIERALFRAKHDSMNALRRLADEAPFMESADALLARAATEIRAYAGAAATAIYERAENCYRLTAFSGSEAPPELVSVDDLAFVRLRKSRARVYLSEVESSLGTNGIAFAFAVRGQLAGALVCRRRADGEAFAPDEVALLASVAHEVGAEVLAIRARRQSELLEALLAGSVNLNDARALSERFSAEPS